MMNSPYRTALTRHEAVGNLIGLLKGPYYIMENDHSHSEEDDYFDYDEISYDVFYEMNDIYDDLVNIYLDAKERNEDENTLSKHQEAIKEFKRKQAIAMRVLQYFDDEISKDHQSAIRRDVTLSSENVPLYTIVSIMEWAENKFSTNNLTDLSKPINLNITNENKDSEEDDTIKFERPFAKNEGTGLENALITTYILSSLVLEKKLGSKPITSEEELVRQFSSKLDSYFPDTYKGRGFHASSIKKSISRGKKLLKSKPEFMSRA